jgi:hypothetical protein
MLWGCTYRHTDWWEGFTNYAVEMGSDTMIFIPSLIKISSSVKNSWGIHRHTDWKAIS